MKRKKKFLASHFAFYVKKLKLHIKNQEFKDLLQLADKEVIERIRADYSKSNYNLSPEQFIIYSDFIFDFTEKKELGIEYTPIKVATKMAEMILFESESKENCDLKIIDPAVGGGIFLIILARIIHQKTNIKMEKIIEDNIFGVDKVSEQVLLCKLSLFILCSEYSSEEPKKYNIYNFDSFKLVETDLKSIFGVSSFDIVITNPPYIRSKNLNNSLKEYLKANYESIFGIVDSYIPFFEVSLGLLKPGGYAIQITPNSYLTSLNGRSLRKYLVRESTEVKIINFNNQKLFNGVSSYSAITLLQKREDSSKTCEVKYLNESLKDVDFSKKGELKWLEIRQKDTWRTLNDEELKIVDKAEHVFETKLADLKFKNGIATQRNNIYSFKFYKEDSQYYYFKSKDRDYKVEKDITRPFITPNEREQPDDQRIIFPYKFNEITLKNEVISEVDMKKYYPKTYAYLLDNKYELDKRASDSSIPAWYAYGRSQGLNDFGNRLYLPYMANEVHTIISSDNSEVFAAGYAIFHENLPYLKVLSDIITSDFFSYYISLVSKPYSKEYYSTAKNLIKKFSVPSEFEASHLADKYRLSDEAIFDLYNLTPTERSLITKTNKKR